MYVHTCNVLNNYKWMKPFVVLKLKDKKYITFKKKFELSCKFYKKNQA